MKYNKFNKKYGGWTPDNSRIVIASDDEEPPAVNEFGEPVKRKSRLTTPRPKSTDVFVAHPPSPHEKDIRIKHEPELRGGFLELSKKGNVRFTSYEESS